MALVEKYTFNASVSTTELSLTGGSSTIQARTDAGSYGVFVSTANLAKGDVFQICGYEKVISGGTQRKFASWTISGVHDEDQPPLFFGLMHGWDFTIQRLAGADRTMVVSVRGYE